jgi:hypothetical protein
MCIWELLEVSAGESGKVGTEFKRYEAYTEMSQWEAELSCTTADLQNASAAVKSRRCHDRVDHLWRVRWAVQVIVFGDSIKGLTSACGFVFVRRLAHDLILSRRPILGDHPEGKPEDSMSKSSSQDKQPGSSRN